MRGGTALEGRISRFIEDTRDEDGAQNFVWLPDRGVMVHIDSCTDPALISAADERLAAELVHARAKLARAQIPKQLLEGRRSWLLGELGELSDY